MSDILLETRLVGDIEGDFYLPDYQRGYRWTGEEIRLMLDDIYENGGKSYCLQPIVVKKVGGRYELIDGQQRLTTIFLIYTYLASKLGPLYAPRFSLEYETRKKSGKFLKELDMSRRDDNIDFHFIVEAYEVIERYFETDSKGEPVKLKASRLTALNQYFDESVSVIWYEVDSDENGIELFERLNIGKIPLTSSELVKALFLRESAGEEMSGRQDEISLQWDSMEHSLRESSFWAFLTNSKVDDYPTRINLLLDLIADKAESDKEKYRTFFYFDIKIKSRRDAGDKKALISEWTEIYHVFLTLREWYSNHDFYHKIGYLIYSGSMSLGRIYRLWRGAGEDPLPKDVFEALLDDEIRRSIDIPDREKLESLSYNDTPDKLKRVLLLFNVETERIMDSGKRRFPFDKHKAGNWSLEHIHAQHSEGLSTNDKILVWLKDHARILKQSILPDTEALLETLGELIDDLETVKVPKNVRSRFDSIQKAVVKFFTRKENSEDDSEYLHNIANMALIDVGQNAALSNYVFDAKRDIIIGYDRTGQYIPVCTKMVFFKYYSPVSASLHFWGEEDRKAYVDAIDEMLSGYYISTDDNTTEFSLE